MRDEFGLNGRPNDQRGFVHKKILGLAGTVLSTAGAIGSFLPGSQFLRTAGTIATGISRGGRQPSSRAPGRPPPEILETMIIGKPTQFRAGGRGGQGTGGEFFIESGNGKCPTDEPRACPPRGFHVNKSSYFLTDGTFVEAGSRFVRNRRLNNANGRAQDKAIVRLEKGQDHAKKLLKATGWRTISKRSAREMRNANKKVCA